MSNFDTIQTSFLGGEISPRLLGRSDLDLYKAGLSKCDNFIVRPHGLVERRGGTKFIAEVKDSSDTTILHEWNVSGHHYMLEFGDLYVRLYEDQAIKGTSPTEIVTTYTEDQVEDIRFAEEGTVLYMVHGEEHPKILRYTDASDITFSDTSWNAFDPTPSTIGGGYVVGDLIVTTQGGGVTTQSILEVIVVNSSSGLVKVRTVVPGTNRVAAGITTSPIAPGTGTGATVDCISDSHPPEWGTDNYPTLVWFFEQRLMFAATPEDQNGIWGSQSADYNNFNLGTGLDHEGISIFVKKARKFVWSMSSDVLMLGADNAEFLISTSSPQNILTPAGIRPIQISQYGSSAVPAAIIDSKAVFVQRGLRKVRRLEFDVSSNQYTATDTTVLSEHLTQGGIIDIAYVNEPDSLIWYLRTDGSLICQTYDPENGVFAWHIHQLAGSDVVVKSIAVTNGQVVGRDELWMVVERTVEESTVRYLEVLTPGLGPEDAKEDAFFVDSGVTATGSDLDTVTGLEHLF